AKADDGIDFQRSNKTGARFDHPRVRIHFEIVKPNHLNAGFFKRPDCFVDVSGGNHAVIRAEQSASKVQFARQLAKTVYDSSAKDHASTRLKVKRPHLRAVVGLGAVASDNA